jgi:hypothetical protein
MKGIRGNIPESKSEEKICGSELGKDFREKLTKFRENCGTFRKSFRFRERSKKCFCPNPNPNSNKKNSDTQYWFRVYHFPLENYAE